MQEIKLISTHLTHIGAGIVSLNICNMQFPCIVTIVCHRYSTIQCHHMCMNCQNCLRIRFNPCNLHRRRQGKLCKFQITSIVAGQTFSFLPPKLTGNKPTSLNIHETLKLNQQATSSDTFLGNRLWCMWRGVGRVLTQKKCSLILQLVDGGNQSPIM